MNMTSSPAPEPAAPSPVTSPANLQALLGDERPSRWWQRPSRWIAVAVLLLLAAGLYYWQATKTRSDVPAYVTTPLRKGNLTPVSYTHLTLPTSDLV